MLRKIKCAIALMLLIAQTASADSYLKGFTGACLAAVKSQDLALDKETRVAISDIARSQGSKRIKSEDDLRQRNRETRDAVRAIIGESRVSRHNDAVVQQYFEVLQPEMAFEWLEMELTDGECEAMREIRLTDEQRDQLMADRLEVVIDFLSPFIAPAKLREALGKPFVFRSKTLSAPVRDLFAMQDVEPVRVLISSFVWMELGVNAEQIKKIDQLAKSHRSEDLLGHLPTKDVLRGANLEQIRTKAIEDAESILTDEQKARFREIVLRRYLNVDDPEYGLRYLGIDMEERGPAYEKYWKYGRGLGGELKAVRRLRVNEIMRVAVGEIIGMVKVDKMMGEPTVYNSGRGVPLPMKSALLNELIGKRRSVGQGKNPRWRDRK